MNRNLSSAQWSQTSLPGMPAPAHTSASSVPGARQDAVEEYTNIRHAPYVDPDATDMWIDNPLNDGLDPRADAPMGPVKYPHGTDMEQWIPTWRINSRQTVINDDAVNHMVEHANPLALDDDPRITQYIAPQAEVGHNEPVPYYRVGDGNHRVNAAQRRGQLLIPRHVEPWEKNRDEDPK